MFVLSPRSSYALHKHWRLVLKDMAVIAACQQVTMSPPVFSDPFSNFRSTNPNDTVTIGTIWAFISLLFDFVSESLALKLLSGESSTATANQHAEQILVGIGATVLPLVNFYANICTSELFNRIVGRTNILNATTCSFSSISEILGDAGGRYIFCLVRDYVSEL